MYRTSIFIRHREDGRNHAKCWLFFKLGGSPGERPDVARMFEKFHLQWAIEARDRKQWEERACKPNR